MGKVDLGVGELSRDDGLGISSGESESTGGCCIRELEVKYFIDL